VKAVNVGDQVEAGGALAKLDSQDELNALRSAESTFAAAQGQLIYGRGDFERRRQPLANGTHREPGSTSRKTVCKAHNPRSMTQKLDCRSRGIASAGPFSKRTRPLGEVRFPPVVRTMTPSHTIGTDNGFSESHPARSLRAAWLASL